MKISKAEKRGLAIRLTGMAIDKHGKELSRQLEELDSELTAAHEAYISELTTIPSAEWPGLIQAGVMTGTTFGPDGWVEGDSVQCPAAEVPLQQRDTLKAVLEHAGWGAVANRVSMRYQVEIRPRLNHTLPDFKGSYRLHKPTSEDPEAYARYYSRALRVMQQACELAKKVHEVLESAREFFNDTVAVLDSCSTRKQLEATLPEAAALLQQKGQSSGALVDVKTVESVRLRLVTGVPDRP